MIEKLHLQLGFMQGRLSPMVEGRIQAFPKDHWKSEFALANDLGLNVMEWTIDREDINQNPIMSANGQREILHYIDMFNFTVPSITLDCCMQKPFWKSQIDFDEEVQLLGKICDEVSNIGVRKLVLPLVDNGRLQTETQLKALINGLAKIENKLSQNAQKIAFEVDFEPEKVKHFIQLFDQDLYGINYDLGNSASLGYSSQDEFEEYGESIINIHIKDRMYRGHTVRLGEGNADFAAFTSQLVDSEYRGYLILQTARATEDSIKSHITELEKNIKFVKNQLEVAR